MSLALCLAMEIFLICLKSAKELSQLITIEVSSRLLKVTFSPFLLFLKNTTCFLFSIIYNDLDSIHHPLQGLILLTCDLALEHHRYYHTIECIFLCPSQDLFINIFMVYHVRITFVALGFKLPSPFIKWAF